MVGHDGVVGGSAALDGKVALNRGIVQIEGAASILWHDTTKAQEAATNMKITAQDMVRFGIIDTVIPEPTGGAHRDPKAAIVAVGDSIANAFEELRGIDSDAVRKQRREKFLAMGRTTARAPG